MRYFIAATLVASALAVPHYAQQPSYGSGYSTGEESSAVSYPAVTPTPEVPHYSEKPTSLSKVIASSVETPSSSAPSYGGGYSVETPLPSSKPSHEPSYPAVPEVPSHSTAPAPSSECTTKTTVTVTLPYPTTPVVPSGTGYPPKPSGTGYPVAPPYPSVPAVSSAPYPSVPAGTGSPSVVKPSGTGYPTKPTAPGQFTGAASLNNAGAFIAGVGAFAAFFL